MAGIIDGAILFFKVFLVKVRAANKKKIYQEYQTTSTSAQNIRTTSCSKCNPFYTGASASEMKVGAVEKYRQRAQK
ncbi:15233_t:CDS:2, partial [Entrophospora sp. SA101]